MGISFVSSNETVKNVASMVAVIIVVWLWNMQMTAQARRLHAAEQMKEALSDLLNASDSDAANYRVRLEAAKAMCDYEDATREEMGLPRMIRGGLASEE